MRQAFGAYWTGLSRNFHVGYRFDPCSLVARPSRGMSDSRRFRVWFVSGPQSKSDNVVRAGPTVSWCEWRCRNGAADRASDRGGNRCAQLRHYKYLWTSPCPLTGRCLRVGGRIYEWCPFNGSVNVMVKRRKRPGRSAKGQRAKSFDASSGRDYRPGLKSRSCYVGTGNLPTPPLAGRRLM